MTTYERRAPNRRPILHYTRWYGSDRPRYPGRNVRSAKMHQV
jgi:hypothetical protein